MDQQVLQMADVLDSFVQSLHFTYSFPSAKGQCGTEND
jgi:hypothetical protein